MRRFDKARPGTVRVESQGSYWFFDEAAHEYMRLPKHEAPRERPEWSDERAGVLQDAVWHPYVSYVVNAEATGNLPPGLCIRYVDELGRDLIAYAPPP